ncbi:MAG: hypothetical protein ACK4NR_00275 [Micavibrio sp.]
MKKITLVHKTLLTALVLTTLGLPVAPKAFAQAMIMPVRVTFENRDRMQEITLFNPSRTAPVTYKLEWLNRRMTEDGNYVATDGPLNPELDPETALLFSPKQITLPPNGKQKLRISLRRPADLPDGEYRAHLNVVRQGNTRANTRMGSVDAEGMTVKMGMNVGIAIPVIVRQGGPYDSTAAINPPQFLPASADGKQPAKIQFDLTRTGKYSTNGNITVYWTPVGGEEQEIAMRSNVKVYHEINRLQVTMPLKKGLTQISGGKVRIVYEGIEPDDGIKFDEKTFAIGG